MDGMKTYREQLEICYRLRTQQPLDLRMESERISKIIAHVGVEENDKDRCAELILMTAASCDMDRYFCGDIEGWLKCVTDRLRNYAEQYVEQQNELNGFSGKKPLPPDVMFEGIERFRDRGLRAFFSLPDEKQIQK